MDISLIEPDKDKTSYHYKVNIDGIIHNGYLTYELHPTKSKDRSVLLINDININNKLSSYQNEEYQRLMEYLKEFASGRFGKMKNIVNRIVEGEIILPNVKVAVHKFGPVPVYSLPEKHSIVLHNTDINLQIGIYPQIPRMNLKDSRIKYTPSFIPSKFEFLRSLNSCIDLLFQRYLEDVGEIFYDIENLSNSTQIYQKAKEVEDILGESINSKLKQIIPSKINFHKFLDNKPIDQQVECKIFHKETDWIFTAKFARQFALFFLNELYKHIGIKSFSEKYINGFEKIKTIFDELLGSGWYSHSRQERIEQLSLLFKALKYYHNKQYEELMALSSDIHWTKRFLQFAQFNAQLNSLNVDPIQGRIFISHQHDVPATEILKSQIEKFVKNNFDEKIKILYCKSSRINLNIRESIKPMIWVSDSVTGIIPKEPRPVSDLSKEKNYVWIALEADHGLLLDKHLIYLVEDGTQLEKVIKDFKDKELDFFVTDKRINLDKRINKLSGSLKDYLYGKFDIKSDDREAENLDARIQKVITDEAENAIRRRHNAMIVGFYYQFPENIRLTLVHLQNIIPYPIKQNKNWVIEKLNQNFRDHYTTLKSAERAFNSTWLLNKKRGLYVNGSAKYLLDLLDKRYYTANLISILKVLEPDCSNSRIDEWKSQILSIVDSPNF